jgi:uncharacterized membrane protein YccC
MPLKRYLVTILAGVGIFAAVYLIDALLAATGMHAETTSIDDVLLGLIVAGLVFVLQWQNERELRRQQRCAAVIAEMNHHIRNALQVIVTRANLSLNSHLELTQITAAVERIDWSLREILPHSLGTPEPFNPESWKNPDSERRPEPASPPSQPPAVN